MAQAGDWQLERYRPLLRLLARQFRIDPRFRRRFDSSDLVQETLLRAHDRLAQFRGRTEAELVKWLEEILGHVVIDEVRKAKAQKRDLDLERSLQAAVAESSARLENFLAADQASPSRQAEHQELLLRLADALDQLPEDQRDAVVQRDLMGQAVKRIAEQMGRTEKAVALLLYRGRRKLRELLEDFQGEAHDV